MRKYKKSGIFNEIKGRVRFKESLKRHTSFRIGGAAKFFIQPKDIADLKLVLISAKKYNIPVFIVGAGSNILVDDKGLEAIVLSLSTAYFKKISYSQQYLEAGSGFSLNRMVSGAARHGLSGLEFLIGIPGTLGGALAMNAGAWGKKIADIVENVTVADYHGNIKKLDRKNIRFVYRGSSLQRYIIINARLRLCKKKKKEIQNTICEYLKARRSSQGDLALSAGSIFKNPTSGSPAGKLIEQCGLKGRRIGDAYVSPKHANFILNKNKASSTDVIKLISLIRRRVKDKFNIELEPEIKIWR
ncbi:MAG: UDP-N-acetylmuramate dehydrogenase [Candidatus Omnitrophica bacterium]|nr:UDP-N-acetylmuramate dehydrogenase [Candidatus Omnitrophota bacterium]